MPVRDDRRDHLRERVSYWAHRLKVEPRIVRVAPMNRKWGSCSRLGIITLAVDLADRDRGFQDFVIAHELLHLRLPNHGKLFKATMAVHVPDWKRYEIERIERNDQ